MKPGCVSFAKICVRGSPPFSPVRPFTRFSKGSRPIDQRAALLSSSNADELGNSYSTDQSMSGQWCNAVSEGRSIRHREKMAGAKSLRTSFELRPCLRVRSPRPTIATLRFTAEWAPLDDCELRRRSRARVHARCAWIPRSSRQSEALVRPLLSRMNRTCAADVKLLLQLSSSVCALSGTRIER